MTGVQTCSSDLLGARPLRDATEWLDSYRALWEASFQRLDALLDELKRKKKKTRRRAP